MDFKKQKSDSPTYLKEVNIAKHAATSVSVFTSTILPVMFACWCVIGLISYFSVWLLDEFSYTPIAITCGFGFSQVLGAHGEDQSFSLAALKLSR